MKHQAKKQTRNQHMPVVIVCILILVLAVMGLGMHFIKKYIPTKERMKSYRILWTARRWGNGSCSGN